MKQTGGKTQSEGADGIRFADASPRFGGMPRIPRRVLWLAAALCDAPASSRCAHAFRPLTARWHEVFVLFWKAGGMIEQASREPGLKRGVGLLPYLCEPRRDRETTGSARRRHAERMPPASKTKPGSAKTPNVKRKKEGAGRKTSFFPPLLQKSASAARLFTGS